MVDRFPGWFSRTTPHPLFLGVGRIEARVDDAARGNELGLSPLNFEITLPFCFYRHAYSPPPKKKIRERVSSSPYGMVQSCPRNQGRPCPSITESRLLAPPPTTTISNLVSSAHAHPTREKGGGWLWRLEGGEWASRRGFLDECEREWESRQYAWASRARPTRLASGS